MSDRVVAQKCGVDGKTVASVRREFNLNVDIHIGKDGRRHKMPRKKK